MKNPLPSSPPAPTLWHWFDRWTAKLRPHRRWLSLLVDGVVIVLCWNFTHLFRLGFEHWLDLRPPYDTLVLAGTVAVYWLALLALRIPSSLWRFSGFSEAKRLAVVSVVAGAVVAVGVRALELHGIPRSVLALHPFMTFVGLCVARFAYRVLYEHARSRITQPSRARRALVMGAGEAAKMLLAGIHRQGWQVVGLLDDEPAKRGVLLAGIPVRGALDEVAQVAMEVGATHLIIALPNASTAAVRDWRYLPN
jgi:FlaA1/EpsC-like NDP-sugar epimerase